MSHRVALGKSRITLRASGSLEAFFDGALYLRKLVLEITDRCMAFDYSFDRLGSQRLCMFAVPAEESFLKVWELKGWLGGLGYGVSPGV